MATMESPFLRRCSLRSDKVGKQTTQNYTDKTVNADGGMRSAGRKRTDWVGTGLRRGPNGFAEIHAQCQEVWNQNRTRPPTEVGPISGSNETLGLAPVPAGTLLRPIATMVAPPPTASAPRTT